LVALRSRGVHVDTHVPAGAPSPAAVLRHPGMMEEVRAAAQWARSRLAAEPDTRIGVVVPELTRLRPTIARIFDEVLLPERLVHPGRSAARPWNISLGRPLAQWPLVHMALLVLELARGSLTIHGAGLLLRSPFLGGGESERIARSLLDARLRRLGDPHVTLEQLIYHAGVEGHAYTCGVLVDRLMALRYRVRELPTSAQPVSFWGPALQSLLSAVQWPGERELNSDEYQTFLKWKELMAGLAQLDLVSAPLTFEAAVHTLRRLAGEELFQPETPDVPIQVLGLLESAQLEFDHLLVLGLTDEAWPRMPRPNPLLPAELQRARGVPRAAAHGELASASRLQSGWRQAATHVLFSYHSADGDRALGPSPLLAGLPEVTLAELGIEEPADWRREVFASRKQEVIADWTGFALPAAAAFDGGARLLQDQAACPFRAFAAHRLGAVSLRHPQEGLDAGDRGTLLHAALACLWSELSSQRRLVESGEAELLALIERCVDRALQRLRPRRASAFQNHFLALERERLVALAREWLEIERRRDAFDVLACEEDRVVSVGGLDLRLRLDRVDRLAGGGRLLLDYKTGDSEIAMWMGERPDEPQVPLYTLIQTVAADAVAFAHVRRGDCGFVGLAAHGGVADGVTELAQSRYLPDYADWPALLAAWRSTLDRLAVAFRSGAAPVDPKKRPITCRNCDLHTLCRVSELADRGAPIAPEEVADE
jgi:ATP-dependent helicase/nuclease subunit B